MGAYKFNHHFGIKKWMVFLFIPSGETRRTTKAGLSLTSGSREVIIRTMAWGFSSSGVERQFSRGNWLKGHREMTVPLANDELRATEFVNNPEELLGGTIFNNELTGTITQIHGKLSWPTSCHPQSLSSLVLLYYGNCHDLPVVIPNR